MNKIALIVLVVLSGDLFAQDFILSPEKLEKLDSLSNFMCKHGGDCSINGKIISVSTSKTKFIDVDGKEIYQIDCLMVDNKDTSSITQYTLGTKGKIDFSILPSRLLKNKSYSLNFCCRPISIHYFMLQLVSPQNFFLVNSDRFVWLEGKVPPKVKVEKRVVGLFVYDRNEVWDIIIVNGQIHKLRKLEVM